MLVTYLSSLLEADDIFCKRLIGYVQHAIAEYVDHENGRVHVIEYENETNCDKRRCHPTLKKE